VNLLMKYFYIPILVFGALGLYNVYQEHNQKIATLEADKETEEIRVRKAKRSLKEIDAFKKNLEEAERNFAKIQKELAILRSKLPSSRNTSEVLSLIGNRATELKLKNQSLSLGQEIKSIDYVRESYNFSGEGTFPQLIVFLERIKDTERIIDFGGISIKSKNEESSRYNYLQMTNRIFSYRYLEKPVVNKSAEGAQQ